MHNRLKKQQQTASSLLIKDNCQYSEYIIISSNFIKLFRESGEPALQTEKDRLTFW